MKRASATASASTTCCWRESSSTPGVTALLGDLADGALPGVREGLEHVERDERWHVGFGLRCLIETLPSQERVDDLVARGVAGRRGLG